MSTDNLEPCPRISEGPITRAEIEWAMRYVKYIRTDGWWSPTNWGKRLGDLIAALTNHDLLGDSGITYSWDGTFENAVELIMRAGLDIIY